MGLILSSNFLLGLNFHFLKTVHPTPASATIAATTMIMMNVVLLIPAILSSPESVLAEAADAEEEAVTWTTVELREAVTMVVRVTEDGAAEADDSSAEGEGDAIAATGTAELAGSENDSSEVETTSALG